MTVNLVRSARIALLVATFVGLIVAGAPSAHAVPPVRGGPFTVDDALLAEIAQEIEQTCGVEVANVTGSGSVRFTRFVNEDGEFVRAEETYHLTFDVTTTAGVEYILRERSVDRYDFVGGQFVYVSTSGRNPFGRSGGVDPGWVGLQRTDGRDSGHVLSICP